MIQNFAHRPCHEIVTGCSGTGKTTFWLNLAKRQRARWRFVYDHKGGEIAFKLGQPAIRSFDHLIECASAAGIMRSGGWVCFDPSLVFADDFYAGFAFFCDFVWSIATQFPGRKMLLVDELQNVTRNRGEGTREFQIMLNTGRSFELDTYSIASRANSIHCDARGQFTKIYAFRQQDDNATDFLEKAGFDIDQVRTLPPGKYLWRDLNSGESGSGGSAFSGK
jgi:hypothetical protein